MTHSTISHPLKYISGMADARVVKLCAQFGPRSITLVMTNCPPSGRGQGHTMADL